MPLFSKLPHRYRTSGFIRQKFESYIGSRLWCRAVLIDACLRDPSLTGVGLDISAPAIEEANELCIKYNLTNRLTFVVGDAFQPDSWSEECRKADVICAVGVIHEHFRDGEQAVINILNTYAKSMKNKCKRFILGEPEIRYDLEKMIVIYILSISLPLRGFLVIGKNGWKLLKN